MIIEELKSEYPMYIFGKTVSDNYSEDKTKDGVKINPLDEFINFCVENYYEKVENKEVSFYDIVNMDKDDVDAVFSDFKSVYGDSIPINYKYAKNSRGVDKLISIDFGKDATDGVTLIFDDNNIGFIQSDYDNVIVVDIVFSDSSRFNYLLPSMDIKDMIKFYCFDGKGKKKMTNQLGIALSIIIGWNEFQKFMKYHKIKSLKINSIDSYIKELAKTNNINNIKIRFNYEDIIVSYGGKNINDKISVFRISYETYPDDIDKMFETLTGKIYKS